MSYTAPKHTIPAGERLELPGEGKFVRVLEASDWFELGLDGDALHFIEQGLAVESTGFNKLVIYNPQTVPITVRLGIANGVIHDSRFSVPGTLGVQVQNFPATAVVAEKDKPGVVPLGSSSTRLNNAPAMSALVDPAINTNGVIIRHCGLKASGSESLIMAGTTKPTGFYDLVAATLMHLPSGHTGRLENIYLAPGKGLWATQYSGTVYAYADYDVLP